jgi:hypothetical protein
MGNTEITGKYLEKEKEKIRKYIYVGKTCRSTYERGKEHYADIGQLKPLSHMLKHLVDLHETEDFSKADFRMEIITFSRSAYDCQVMEAVQIDHHKHHHVLNSRAEFNRSAVPRLGLKLGGKDFKGLEKDETAKSEKEETLMSKIRDLRKKRNLERRNRRERQEPKHKRR